MKKYIRVLGIVLLIALVLMGLVRSYPLLHPLDYLNTTETGREVTLDTVENRSATAGELLEFRVRGTDTGGKPLSYEASPLPPGAQMDEATGTFRWTPAANQSGTHWITLTATNGRSHAEQLITITVIHRNRPPVLQPVEDLTVMAGQRMELRLNGSDPDGDQLTYSLSTLYPGATFDNRTGVFVWEVPAAMYGTGMVAVDVWDGWETSRQIITITILRPEMAGMPRERSLRELLGYLPEEELAVTLLDPSRQIHVVTPSLGPELQDRIAMASPGDIILVYPGTYHGGIIVDRSLILLGVDDPVIDAHGTGSVVSLTAGGATVAGFTLVNSGTGTYDSGIKVSSSGNRILANRISGHQYGVNLLPPADGNLIRNNTITNSSADGIRGENLRDKTLIDSNLIANHGIDGVHIEYSWNVSFRNNTIAFNRGNGITVNYSHKTTLTGNRVESNHLDGTFISSGARDIVDGNTFSLNGNNGLTMMRSQDPDLTGEMIDNYTQSEYLNRVRDNTCAGNGRAGIAIREITVSVGGNDLRFNGYGIWSMGAAARIAGNRASRNHVGILLSSTEHSMVWGNEAGENEYGIQLEGRSLMNVISTNNASVNRQYGISLGADTEGNVIRDNLEFGNAIACISDAGKNMVTANDCRRGEEEPF